MKRFILLVITFLTLSTVTFASFPVTEDINTEVIISNDSSETSAPDSKMIGILLGFFLGIFGVLIAYLMDDREMVKWAWKGFLGVLIIVVVLYLLLLMAIISGGGIGFYA